MRRGASILVKRWVPARVRNGWVGRLASFLPKQKNRAGSHRPFFPSSVMVAPVHAVNSGYTMFCL